jgi:hypothetical protein
MFASVLWILFATICRPTQVAASLTGDLGSFSSPKTGVKWRYWIEDGSASPDVLRSDVSEMARVGSSGFELLRYSIPYSTFYLLTTFSYQSYGGEAQNTGVHLPGHPISVH